MKETAVEHFNNRRGNCAQSVALAWENRQNSETGRVPQLSKAGGGRAPEGLCGALYAACEIAGESLSPKLTDRFKEAASGHATCRDIRKNRIMPCAQCVATAAGILEELAEEIAS